MANRKLKVLLNVGLDDQKKYGIPNGADDANPPVEGEVISVDENIANIMVNVLKLAKDYDAEDEKALKAKAAAETEAARVAKEAAEKEAVKK